MAIFQQPAIGLDISDHSIEAVFIVRRGDRLEVASYGRATLPPGVIVGGYVERRDVASQILRKLLADQMTPPLPQGARRVVFALPESQVYSHIFEVPRIADDAELGRSLAIEADGYFPYHHDEMASGYAAIAQRPDKKEIFYAAVHKDTLKSYLSLLTVSGLQPIAVEGESASIARATILREDVDPVMILDIGARVSDIAVFDRSGIQFSEALETAGDAFTEALARSLGISAEDAESLKRNQGVSGDLDLRAQKALQAEIERLVRDAKAAMAFYEEKSKRMITRVVLCGGSVLMPGLLEALSAKLSVPGRTLHVETADPWANLGISPILEKLGLRDRGVLATTAVGLALRGAGVRKFADIDFLAGATAPAQGRTDFAAGPGAASGVRSAFGHLPRWLKIAVAATAVLALAVAVWFLTFRLRAPAASPEASTTAAPDVREFDVTVRLAETYSEADGAIEWHPVEAQKTVEIDVQHAATAVEGTAGGDVVIYNEGRSSQPLVATTRFLSEDGVLFRLKDRVTIPPGGRVTARIEADEPGATGDVPAGRWTIPGLPPATQQVVYGISEAAMTGGVVLDGAPLTQEELDAAVASALEQGREDMTLLARSEAGDGFLMPDALFGGVTASAVDPPHVGRPAGPFRLKVLLKATGSAIPADQLESIMRAGLKALLPEGSDADAYTLEPVRFERDGGEATAQVMRVRVQASR